MIKRMLGVFLVISAVLLMAPQVVSAARIEFNPEMLSLTEGESQEVTITLDNPIVCADADPCQISLAITTNASSRVSITTSPVVIPANQWSQQFSFTVTATDNDLLDGDITPTVTIDNDSGSEFYNGFIPTFSIVILDNEVAQEAPQNDDQSSEETVTTTENEPTLPATGSNQIPFVMISSVLMLTTTQYVLRKLKRKPQ